jgi:hypothetical protein
MKKLTLLLIAGLCFSVSVGAQTLQEKKEIERAKAFVKSKGLTWGGQGNYGTKGLYTYSAGKYRGKAYFGIGGKVSQQSAPVRKPKERIPGWFEIATSRPAEVAEVSSSNRYTKLNIDTKKPLTQQEINTGDWRMVSRDTRSSTEYYKNKNVEKEATMRKLKKPLAKKQKPLAKKPLEPLEETPSDVAKKPLGGGAPAEVGADSVLAVTSNGRTYKSYAWFETDLRNKLVSGSIVYSDQNVGFEVVRTDYPDGGINTTRILFQSDVNGLFTDGNAYSTNVEVGGGNGATPALTGTEELREETPSEVAKKPLAKKPLAKKPLRGSLTPRQKKPETSSEAHSKKPESLNPMQEKKEIERAKAFVKSKGLTWAGQGNYATKGLYTFSQWHNSNTISPYFGKAYFGIGGTLSQQSAPLQNRFGKQRIPGWFELNLPRFKRHQSNPTFKSVESYTR